MSVTPSSYCSFVGDFIYYGYRPGTTHGTGIIYRLNSDYWTGGEVIQEVHNRRSGEWQPTDMLDYRLIHGDVWLDRLEFDPTSELSNEPSEPVTPLKETMEFLFATPEYTDERVVTVHTLREVEETLPGTLEKMRRSGRRWVVILEPSRDPARYVQVLVTEAGSIWAECVSNEFLEGDHQLDEAHFELLPTLGWEWPGPPASPNWHFHDELLNTGSAITGLMERTLRQVFGVVDKDQVRVIVIPLSDEEKLVDQR